MYEIGHIRCIEQHWRIVTMTRLWKLQWRWATTHSMKWSEYEQLLLVNYIWWAWNEVSLDKGVNNILTIIWILPPHSMEWIEHEWFGQFDYPKCVKCEWFGQSTENYLDIAPIGNRWDTPLLLWGYTKISKSCQQLLTLHKRFQLLDGSTWDKVWTNSPIQWHHRSVLLSKSVLWNEMSPPSCVWNFLT